MMSPSPISQARRWPPVANVLPYLFCLLLVACSPTVTPTLKPVAIRTPTPGGTPGLVSEPNDAKVTIHGDAVDASTGAKIESAAITITTVAGVQQFTGSYQVVIPGNSVITFHVEADGYLPFDEPLNPHYKRNVDLEIHLRLEHQ